MMSRMPNQKPGMDTPSSEAAVATRSRFVFLRTAASTPKGTAVARANTMAAKVSSMVAGRRLRITSLIGWR